MSHDVTGSRSPEAWRATAGDATAVGRLLDAFNREYDEPTPGPEVLRDRAARMIAAGDIVVFLIGDGPDGIAQLQFRASIWSFKPDAYLAELYVVPERRRQGLGRALLTRALDAAIAEGATVIDLSTSEDDTGARMLYETSGFVNEEHGPGGPRMLYFERDLHRGE